MKLHCARALANNHDARLLLPLCGRRWPGHRASERTPVASEGLLVGSDEGSLRRRESSDIVTDPHPTLADARATFSHKWAKETRTKIPSFVRGDNAHA